MKSRYESTWDKPLTKLKGCGKELFVPHYFASRGGVWRYTNQSRKDKKITFEAGVNWPNRPVCGTYMPSSWYRKTRVILCDRCIRRLGIEW